MWCQNPFAFRPGPVSFWTTVVYLAVTIPLLYVHETVPSAPADHSLYRGLNLTEAWLDLQTISNAYHPYNSRNNDLVRDFIVSRSKDILGHNGVEYSTEVLAPAAEQAVHKDVTADQAPVTLFDDRLANVSWTYDTSKLISANVGPSSWMAQYFEGNNYYIYIRGEDDPEGDWWNSHSDYKLTHRKGGVLVNCHFDSVSTGYGATDDGMSCVTMLQLLSYFTSANRQPKNGIVLLFNNAEEDGLFGAYAFGNSPLVQFCHTFVNLEGAGAGGRAMLFRATDLESAEAYSESPHPFGSIVAADAFKLGVIRSGTDYRVFHDEFGQRGLDIAFYEPRSRYHTEDDDARHTSVNSIWHMLSAALASTEKLAQSTGSKFHGDRSDRNKDLVQNGKATPGVWFDMFGSAWAAFPLRGLFAWSLCLLVATPLILVVVTYMLIRKDQYYFFSRDIWIHSEVNDDPVKIGGWRGFFRFPLAFVFAGGLTILASLLVAKVNPFIVYSSGYSVWAMTLSLFYFALWLVMRGSSFVRPSALHRGFVTMWLFIMGWAIQVFAAVAEDRMKLGSLYSVAFLQSAFFASLLISLCELFALPRKHDFAHMLHDAHHARDADAHDNGEHSGFGGDAGHDGHDDASDDSDVDPTETTPLAGGQQDYGSGDQPTFASTYRRSVAPNPEPSNKTTRTYQPYDHEQSWSGRLPTWTWVVQFLLLAPVPVILLGNLGLVTMTSLRMTGADGGNVVTPLMATGLLSIFLLLPLSPFMHRITHHVPLFLLLVFIGTFIYNLAAFPFSANNRFKFYFQQVVDLDQGTDMVHLTGVDEYVRGVIDSLPEASSQTIKCETDFDRAPLKQCRYDASSQPPDVAASKSLEDLLTVTTSRSGDGLTANVILDAPETRTCYLDVSQPIFGFSVEGGAGRDRRFGALPPKGFMRMQVWRREWEGAWNVTLQLQEKGRSSDFEENDFENADESSAFQVDELKTRVDEADEPLEVTVRCAWSDANKPGTIPALTELKKYMPTWAVVSKATVGLVEVRKTYSIPN